MTGEQFVKLCYEEKKTILAEYFNPNSSSVVGKKISAITEQGISKDDLYDQVRKHSLVLLGAISRRFWTAFKMKRRIIYG